MGCKQGIQEEGEKDMKPNTSNKIPRREVEVLLDIAVRHGYAKALDDVEKMIVDCIVHKALDPTYKKEINHVLQHLKQSLAKLKESK